MSAARKTRQRLTRRVRHPPMHQQPASRWLYNGLGHVFLHRYGLARRAVNQYKYLGGASPARHKNNFHHAIGIGLYQTSPSMEFNRSAVEQSAGKLARIGLQSNRYMRFATR